jgi:protein TonB
VAALVVALHAAFLHGWQLTRVGAPREAAPTASAMIVRLLSPSPSVPDAAPAVPAVAAPPEASARGLEAREATRPGRAPAAVGAASAARPTAAPAPSAPPDSAYVAASRLDPGPRLIDDVEPVYPVDAGLTEGKVVLRLLIGTTGAVDEVTVVRATPKGVFDAAAVAAWSAARFSPGRMLGVPVKSQVTIEVHFTPVDRGANVSAPTY